MTWRKDTRLLEFPKLGALLVIYLFSITQIDASSLYTSASLKRHQNQDMAASWQAASQSDLFENSTWHKWRKHNVATFSTQSKKSVIITIIRTWSHGDKVNKFHMYQRTSTACQAVCSQQSTERRKTSQSTALTLLQRNLNVSRVYSSRKIGEKPICQKHN